MTSGTMTMQAMQLSAAERRAVAEYLSGKPFGAGSASGAGAVRHQAARRSRTSRRSRSGTASGVDSSNSRYQPKPGMTAADVPKLKLKWAFGFPGGTQAYGNPAIVAGRVFVGSDNGTVYALDAATGCTHWTFKADGGVRTAPSVGAGRPQVRRLHRRPQGQRLRARRGDRRGDLEEERSTRTASRASPARRSLADGKIYVPVSSIEEAPAAQPNYECCTFRGSVVALEAATGEQLWKSYTITEAPTAGRQELGRHRAVRAGRRGGVELADDRSRRRACSTSAPATRTPDRR